MKRLVKEQKREKTIVKRLETFAKRIKTIIND